MFGTLLGSQNRIIRVVHLIEQFLFWTKWWPFCPKPLEIQTKWPPFCMAFHWFVFRMVGTISIAIAITDHSKTEPL